MAWLTNTPAPPEQLGIPEEVTTAEAAAMLGVAKDTVLRDKSAGLLAYKNIAAPNSSRPIFMFSRASVLALRTGYQTDQEVPAATPEPSRRRMKGQRKYKHLEIDA